MSRFEIKIIAALLLIAIIPLAASVMLLDEVIEVSESVSAGTSARLARPLQKAARAYRELFAAKKRQFHLQAALLARDEALNRAISSDDRPAQKTSLQRLLETHPEIRRIRLTNGEGQLVAEQGRRPDSSPQPSRRLTLEQPLQTGTATAQITFVTARAPFDDYRDLGDVQRSSQALRDLRTELASYYRLAFLSIFGGVLLVATIAGTLVARRIAHQVTVLAQATGRVAEGDLSTRVSVRGRDEVAQLSQAFNEMVAQMQESREKIAYLERMSAWQEIARQVAHQIKNPLTPIQLAAQQLREKCRPDTPNFCRLLNEACDIIGEEVEGLKRWVEAFSSLARLPRINPAPTDINGLIEEFLRAHADIAEQAQVSWTPLQPTAEVMVDRQLFKQLLYNLVENSLQAATQDAGTQAAITVTISARRASGKRRQLALTVADNGPGMPPDVASRAMEPYFTTKEGGTGLGLAIVKKIVLEHSGELSLRSAPGEGTAFTVRVPLV